MIKSEKVISYSRQTINLTTNFSMHSFWCFLWILSILLKYFINSLSAICSWRFFLYVLCKIHCWQLFWIYLNHTDLQRPGHVKFPLLLQVIDQIFCICCKIYLIGMTLEFLFLKHGFYLEYVMHPVLSKYRKKSTGDVKRSKMDEDIVICRLFFSL